MREQQLNALINYRIQQSKETLHEARILYNERAFRGTINRAYYAMFYSVLALLSTKGLGTSKHSGAIGLFDKEFVKQGIFSKEFSKTLRLAFERRQVHDYGELIEIDLDEAKNALDDAQKFIEGVQAYLISEGYLK